MNAVVQMFDNTPRSLVEERAIRPPIIGKIRPGIKVLTRAMQGIHRPSRFTTRWSPPVTRTKQSAKPSNRN